MTWKHLASTGSPESDQRLADGILNSLDAPICLLDVAGTIVRVNEPWRRLGRDCVGRDSTHGVGCNYLHVCDRGAGEGVVSAAEIAAGIRGVIANEQPAYMSQYRCDRSPHPRWYQIRVSPMPHETGAAAVVVYVDVTERVLAERALRERVEAAQRLDASNRASERMVAELHQQKFLMQTVMNNIPCEIFWKDDQLFYLGCNEAFAAAAGFDHPGQIQGKSDWQLPWTPEQAERYRSHDQHVLDARKPTLGVEETQRTADGTTRVLLTSKVPLLGPAAEPIGVLGVFQDITEQKQFERQLAQSQKLESIGQLAAGIAHEINTPMQCVSGNVEFLEGCCEHLFGVIDAARTFLHGPPESWQQRKAEMEHLITDSRFEHIRQEAPAAIEQTGDAVRRVIEIVRAMQAMSHPGSSEKVATDLNQLIHNATAISRNRWKYAATMQLDLQDDLPVITAASSELDQVVLNLIANAADAIADRHDASSDQLGTIVIRTRTERDGVRMEVEDSGCGIPEEVKRRIFDPFFTTKEVGKGTGQGLAISYEVVVNQHAGEITVDSQPNRGTTFSVWLPREPLPTHELLCQDAPDRHAAGPSPRLQPIRPG